MIVLEATDWSEVSLITVVFVKNPTKTDDHFNETFIIDHIFLKKYTLFIKQKFNILYENQKVFEIYFIKENGST